MFIIYQATWSDNNGLETKFLYSCETEDEAHIKLEKIHSELLDEFKEHGWDKSFRGFEDTFTTGCNEFSIAYGYNDDLVIFTTIHEIPNNK